MKIVLQRVKSASVSVDGHKVGCIQQGLLIFLGVGSNDTEEHADSLVDKIMHLRVFDDAQGKMNLSVQDVGAQILVVSQFTLYGNCDKGRRPSFDSAANPQLAENLYNYFVAQLKQYQLKVETGRFRAMMDVSLINDGPVTFILESINKN